MICGNTPWKYLDVCNFITSMFDIAWNFAGAGTNLFGRTLPSGINVIKTNAVPDNGYIVVGSFFADPDYHRRTL